MHLEEDVPRGVVDRAVHRRHREQRGRDERRVRDRVAVRVGDRPMKLAEADAERRAGRRSARTTPREHDDPVGAAGREQAPRPTTAPGCRPDRATPRAGVGGRPSPPLRRQRRRPCSGVGSKFRTLTCRASSPRCATRAASRTIESRDEDSDVDDRSQIGSVGAVAHELTRRARSPCQSGEIQPIHCRKIGSAREREDRAAEQRERQHDDALHDRELAAVLGDVDGVRGERREREAAVSTAIGIRARPSAAGSRRTISIDERSRPPVASRHAKDDEDHRAVHDLACGDRRRVHADEGRVPLEAEQDAERVLLGRDTRRPRCEQRGRDELEVADAVDTGPTFALTRVASPTPNAKR